MTDSDSESKFDATILQAFNSEIADWPPEQAADALRLIRAVIAGDAKATAVFDVESGEFGRLTAAQIERVHVVLQKMSGEWTH